MAKKPDWSVTEVRILKAFTNKPASWLSENVLCNRTQNAVKLKRMRMGLKVVRRAEDRIKISTRFSRDVYEVMVKRVNDGVEPSIVSIIDRALRAYLEIYEC